jgi:hypothetical protein
VIYFALPMESLVQEKTFMIEETPEIPGFLHQTFSMILTSLRNGQPLDLFQIEEVTVSCFHLDSHVMQMEGWWWNGDGISKFRRFSNQIIDSNSPFRTS